MTPNKVKAYGIIDFTKKQYITTQVVVFLILAILLTLSLIYNFTTGSIVILVGVFMESIETIVMLNKFK